MKLTPAEKKILQELGRRGGTTSAKRLTQLQRIVRARKAAKARWDKKERNEITHTSGVSESGYRRE